MTALLVGMALPPTARGRDAKACEEMCTREFREAETVDNADDAYRGVLQRLLSRKESCAGTVIYEARLSIAYSINQDYEHARQVIEPYRGRREYAAWIDLALVYAQHYRGFRTRERVVPLEQALTSFVERHPDVPEAWETLGYVRLLLGRFDPARVALEAAVAAPLEPERVYRDLTICYVQTGRYAEGLAAAHKAYRDGDWANYPTFTLYTAQALMAYGELRTAEAILGEMLTQHPELRSDRSVVRVVALLVEARENAAARGRGSPAAPPGQLVTPPGPSVPAPRPGGKGPTDP